jgi:hypothetical protein
MSSLKLCWVEPRGNAYKLNVDAAFSIDESGSDGVVIHYRSGVFVAASSSFIPHVATANMAEVLAMRHQAWSRISGCNSIKVGSGSMEVINLCLSEDRIWNDATIVYANYFSFANLYGKVEFKHCPREINKVAHSKLDLLLLINFLVKRSMKPSFIY